MSTTPPDSYETDVEEPVRTHPITWTIIFGSILSIFFLFGYFWFAAEEDEPVKVPEYTYVNPNVRGEPGPAGEQPEGYKLDEYDSRYLEACYDAGAYITDPIKQEEYQASCLRGVGID